MATSGAQTGEHGSGARRGRRRPAAGEATAASVSSGSGDGDAPRRSSTSSVARTRRRAAGDRSLGSTGRGGAGEATGEAGGPPRGQGGTAGIANPLNAGEGILRRMAELGDHPIRDAEFYRNVDGSQVEQCWGTKGLYLASNASGRWEVVGPFGGGA